MIPEAAAALVHWALAFINSKSMKVQAPQLPPRGSNADSGNSKKSGMGRAQQRCCQKDQKSSSKVPSTELHQKPSAWAR